MAYRLSQHGIKSLKKSLNKDSQKSKLDNLLLHTSTLLGIILALSQTMIDSKDVIKCFVPLFLFIWLIPVYIGYIKGSIVYDLLSERLRGWIYLIIGTLTYLIFLTVYFLKTRSSLKISTMENYIIAISIGLVILFARHIYKKFMEFFDNEISDAEKYVIKRTIILPVYLGLTALLYLILVNADISNIKDVFSLITEDLGFSVGLIFIATLLIFVYYIEQGNKKIIKNLDKNPKISDKPLFTKDFLIIIAALALSITALLLSLYVFINWKIVFISLVLTPLIGYILLFRIYDVKTITFDG